MTGSTKEWLPNLFIIGAAKSGTTSLHLYLDAHDEIAMSEPKEPGTFAFFSWEKKLSDYKGMLPASTAVRGESSTVYTTFPSMQDVPRRIASKCPEARLIYVVRDPVDRVVAHYVEHYAYLLEHRTLAGALWDLDQPGNYYVTASRYALQLDQWLEHFPREQILVIDQMDLRNERSKVLREVLEFLQVAPVVPPGIDQEFNTNAAKERLSPAAARAWFTLAPAIRRLPPKVVSRLLRSRLFEMEKIGRPSLDDQLRAALEEQLRPDAERFRELTGRQFDSWTI